MSTASSASQQRVLGSITNHSDAYGTQSSLNSNASQHKSNSRKSLVLAAPNLEPIRKRQSSKLSPFEKIKLETDRTTAHGHPLILPTEYGRFGPVFDVISLYHNAIKRQVLVAYNILEALQRFKYEVTLAETQLFFNWFHIFQDAVVTILTVEDEEVFPFLEQNGVIIPDQVNKAERQRAKDLVSDTLGSITASLETIRLMAAGESVAKISSLVRAFLQVIIDYCETQRALLPNVIAAAAITADSETELRVRFIQALNGKENAAIYLPFVSHWLSPRQLGVWKKTNMGRLKALRYDQWKKKFSSSYQEIPVTIMMKLTSSTAPNTPGGRRRPSPTAYLGRKNRYNFR